MGAVGTARLLLHSIGLHRRAVPLLAKGKSYLICLHPRTFGAAGDGARTSLTQLALSDLRLLDCGLPASHTTLRPYGSFQLFRLLGGTPLPLHAGMRLLSLMAPSLVIADVRQPALAASCGLLRIHGAPDGGHRAEVLLPRSHAQTVGRARVLGRVRASLRHLGLWPVARVHAAPGAASHYAGTVPFAEERERHLPLSADPRGGLRQMRDVHLADASTFLNLCAAPPTFTMMANARRVADAVARQLAEGRVRRS